MGHAISYSDLPENMISSTISNTYHAHVKRIPLKNEKGTLHPRLLSRLRKFEKHRRLGLLSSSGTLWTLYSLGTRGPLHQEYEKSLNNTATEALLLIRKRGVCTVCHTHAPSSSSHRVKGFAVLLTMSVDFILDRLAEVPQQEGRSVD